ncbi:hypothetical protein OHA79_34080 [Streptomyces sp. NBC_00841]|uniref:hypothetical protein n=1 Tax=Streptomyces sp. NBC_00841 TaxID=2975847 RepID=UPI002DD7F9AC|nr:hypothetical protein [Streptomyces sp. NBC_00841]WSA02430.1 hypothetical protein OHA79_34080 [Streptomyces sp. NBC_00841]
MRIATYLVRHLQRPLPCRIAQQVHEQLPSVDAALAAWEKDCLVEGTALYRHGVGLGQRLGLNDPAPTTAAAADPAL